MARRDLLRRTRGVGLALFALVASASVLADVARAGSDAYRAGDFAAGRLIEIGSVQSLQSASLDLDVYQRSVEPGLADLRVFDADGETVPHAIRKAPPVPAPEARFEMLPVFRLDAAPTFRGSDSGFRIDAEISESGAILRLYGVVAPSTPAPSISGPPIPGPSTRGAWLIDASPLGGESVTGLVLGLGPSAGDFVAHLRVEASDDLTHFTTRVARAAVARFSRGGHEIERLDVALPATRARYLKVTLIEGALPADLQSVDARIAMPKEVPRPELTQLTGKPVPDEPGRFVYDIGADLPIERIDVLPGEPNTLLDVRIDSSRERAGPWTKRYEGLVYRLEPGGTLRSAPIPWRVGDHRFLRVTVSPKGGGDRQATPEIELAWRPAQLVFVRRGDGPFTLAYGKRGAPDTAFDAQRLVQLAGDARTRLDDTTATLGPPRILAGDRAYAPPPTPVDWRQIALWCVLVATVGVVLWMSVRLLRKAESATDRDAS